ncbi:MAG: UDP-N-acetylmuramate dehydrogenase [Clostridia bacterium]|nr:UDP-N-acetylmuramate dehydrogenase [Clostridia bacterium]
MYKYLTEKFEGLEYDLNAELGKMTSFKTGGTADIVVYPKSVGQFKDIVAALKGRDHVILGGGTNVLVSDSGYHGVVVSTKNLNKIKTVGNILVCECGVKNSAAVTACVQNGLSGLEFAVDIPGTIGGLVAMNAGCYNKACEDAVCYVVAENGVYNKTDCRFSYRKSRFLSGEAVYLAAFKLKIAEEETINFKLNRFRGARTKSQPKGRSCGSVFLNEGFFAGKIIDEVGLKGYSIGSAHVSDTHANFIISEGTSSQDVYDLIRYVKKKVFLDTGTELHEEVIYIGEFYDNKL